MAAQGPDHFAADEGDFGYCVECGEPIALGRLDVDPTFSACVKCAK